MVPQWWITHFHATFQIKDSCGILEDHILSSEHLHKLYGDSTCTFYLRDSKGLTNIYVVYELIQNHLQHNRPDEIVDIEETPSAKVLVEITL